MKLKEQIEVLKNPDRIRIYKGGKIIYSGYLAMLQNIEQAITGDKQGITGDETVTSIRVNTELRHRRWKELGLMKPFNKDETPDYNYSDLQETLYYDIYIE